MTRSTARIPLHSSRLLRALSALACLESAEPGPGFASRLALWVDYTDAIALHALHERRGAGAGGGSAGAAPAPDAVAAVFGRRCAAVEQALAATSLPEADAGSAAVQAGAQASAAQISAAFEPYRRYYLAQQREFELKLPPLRAQLREALGRASPALQQLAALDAALQGILEEREARLLGSLPLLLRKRFAHLLTNAGGTPPLQWLGRFGQELHTVLLAELDLRLQPAKGLVDALTLETHLEPA